MDDGRPVFLFVHTYRAHLPYLVSLASRARVGPSIGLRDDLNLDDYAQVPESIPNWTEAYEPKADLLRRMDNYRAVYRGGTADLDLAFGSFLELLRDYGMRSQAYMLFTSDHGEAFWEHGIAEHGNGVWNEHLDIPLLLVGPDVRAGRQSAPASLIDVPRTIAGLANVQAPASWGGCDLRLTADPAPLLAFECNRYGDPSEAALLDGGRKIILEVDLEARTWEPLAAFDLRTDPDERQNLASAPWVAELLAKHDRRIVQSLEERVVVHSALSHPESARALRELGYAGPADDGQ
jgi:arylsulfatase A-like enzyme